ncbi:MAG: LysM peptidoglycan-binding domain-containing protein [Eubacteriales bacterium]|nr:LysM peptidoglycan-binding domain-containing protein [Eubacteriales bacterium]
MQIVVVKQGDTIYSIAEEYNISAENLINSNKLQNPNNLVVGQTIVIPEDTEKLGTIAINGYLYPSIDKNLLLETLPYLTFATIFTYGFTETGELIPADDEEIIKILTENNVAPIMLISTLTSEGVFSNELANKILNDPVAQENLINNIIENLKLKNYFGLDVDFEYVFPEDKEAFVAFIENLTNSLNEEGFPVITALAPKTSSDQAGLLYEAHDYSAIGNAANAVLLMTYEWGYSAGPPMAVAPINKVKQVLDYAITQIPPEKIFMGMPNYGYDWPLPFVRGETKARSIGNVEAINIALKYNAEILFDEISQAPYFYYSDENGIEHVVWFEDARSIYTKLTTAFSYGFAGVSYWNLMRPFPQNWLVASQLFNIYKI